MTFWVFLTITLTLLGAMNAMGQRWEPFAGTRHRWRDIEFNYRVRSHKGRLHGAFLALEAPDTSRFQLRREGAWDRIGKYLGISREWQTSDETFDDHIYIISDDRVLHSALSADTTLRRAASALLAYPDVKRLEMDRGALIVQISWSSGNRREERELELIEDEAARLLPDLVRFRDRLQSQNAEPWAHNRDPDWRRYRVVVSLLGLMGIAGLAAVLVQNLSDAPPILLQRYHILRAASVVACAVGFAALVLLLLTLGRRSRSHLVMAYLLLVAIPGVLLAAETYYEQVNARTVQERTRFETYVERKYIKRNRKRRDTYHLTLAELPHQGANADIKVDSNTYQRITEYECIVLDLHTGALGDAFIADLRSHRCNSPLDAAR